mgnify:CR=1 FL=1
MNDGLVEFVRRHRPVVLTGAGISVDSGIPDYRGPTARRPRRPIQYRPFVEHPEVRQRYWARAMVGWPHFSKTAPNPAHEALSALQQAGWVRGLITQNVDRLHHRAGSRPVVELHGALAEVECLACRTLVDRNEVQADLHELNPGFCEKAAGQVAPDGDADLPKAAVERFRVAPCRICGGVLKPNVVFFGENVPRQTVDAAWRTWDEAPAILVLGSSLTVFSGFRFVKRAARDGKPIAIVNLGPTRGDDLSQLKVDVPLKERLPALADTLAAG